MAVFRRLPGSHMHVRTPIMMGVIALLVVLLSAFCVYRNIAPGEQPGLAGNHSGTVARALPAGEGLGS